MAWKGFKDIQATIIIDLSKDDEELWNGLDKDARWGVKKAIKEKLIVEGTEDEGEIKEFYNIYKQTCKYGGINPETLEDIMKEEPVFFICKKEGKIIAGAVVKIKEKEKSVVLFLNASLYVYLKYQPNNILYWYIIKWAKKNGFSNFDLGGYQLNTRKDDKLHAINRFKERWGGKINMYYVYSHNPIKILGRKAIRNSKSARWLWDKIKGRPSGKREVKEKKNEEKKQEK